MDDANLAKLSVDKPGLKPEFNKDTLDYSITVPFSVQELKIKAVTSDRGASSSIKSTTGYGDQIKLNEGENKIQIEVTSEDGTVKKYSITCNRLSASNALLEKLNFESLSLEPEFEPGHFDYELCPSNHMLNVNLNLSSFDPNCDIEIKLNDKIEQKDTNGKYNLNLNHTYSHLLIKVLSANKSNEQIYSIKILKSPSVRLCIFDELDVDFQDPISLGPILTPVSLDKTKITYSKPVIDSLENICNIDGLSLISLSIHDNFSKVIDIGLENQISNLKIKIPLLNGLYSKQVCLKEISTVHEEINSVDKMPDLDEEYKNFKSKQTEDIPNLNEAYQVKPWEKQLQIIYEEVDHEVLFSQSQSSFANYLSVLSVEKSRKKIKSNENNSAIYFLNKSIYESATATKFDTKNFVYHFWLAKLLEEKIFFINFYGPEEQEEKQTSLVLQNKIAEEGSKDDEINAICRLRNVGPTATNAEKLKALDMEYQHLKETNQHFKAEQVQRLYQYKAKKTIDESKKDNNSNDYNNFIYQANIKYMDGLGIILRNKQEDFLAFLQTGKSFFYIKDFKRALPFFTKCLNWSDNEFRTLSRFYFGLTLSKQTELNENSLKLIVHSLCSGLELFLENLNKNFQNKQTTSFAENNYSLFKLEFLEAFLIIGKLQRSFKTNMETIKPHDSFKYCAWLCCLALIEFNKKSPIDKDILVNSKLLKDLIVLLIDAHYNLAMDANINHLDKAKVKNLMNLIDLIRSLGNRENQHILKIQEEVSQILVFSNIEEFYFLLLLGCAKFELYDFMNENKLDSDLDGLNGLLNESKDALTCCNQMFDKPLTEELKDLIRSHKWWLKFSETKIKKKEEPKIEQTRPTSSNKSKIIVKDSKIAQTKSNAASKPVVKKDTTQPATKNVPAGKTAPTKSTHECKPVKTQPENLVTEKSSVEPSNVNDSLNLEKNPKIEMKINIDKNILFNQCQLYLARVYTRQKNFDQAKEFFLKVIEKEPKKQEAYIELASMLKKNNDLMGAVDVYSKYPLDLDNNKQTSGDSFDDAYICGELVSLLISAQNYDDPRLTKYLIIWAKIFGISIIEKYIAILDKANKVKACKEVYASVHGKSVDDADLQQFFKLKGWI